MNRPAGVLRCLPCDDSDSRVNRLARAFDLHRPLQCSWGAQQSPQLMQTFTLTLQARELIRINPFRTDVLPR
ncbi:MAG: hypothetical protein VYA84_11960 [Planctomycetota bacterium]|nr:hypothetical protein [Planctomycetota bacterium]